MLELSSTRLAPVKPRSRGFRT